MFFVKRKEIYDYFIIKNSSYFTQKLLSPYSYFLNSIILQCNTSFFISLD